MKSKRLCSLILTLCLVVCAAVVMAEEYHQYAPGETNEWGWVMPEETITFSHFYTNTTKNPNKDAEDLEKLIDYIYEHFNVKIERRVADSDPQDTLNLLLAAGSYPDVIVGLQPIGFEKWKEQGRLVDLTDLVEKEGTNIKDSIGDNFTRYLDEDGKLFYLPNGYGGDIYPWYSASVRYDQYLEMGSPEILTLEEYHDYLKALVEKYPTNKDGQKTYALSWNDQLRLYMISGFWGMKEGYKEGPDHVLTHWLNTDEGLAMTKYFNQYYREGLLDPDAFINKYDDWKMKMSNERVLGHIGQWFEVDDAGYQVWQKTDPDWTENKRFVHLNVKAQDAEAAYLAPKDELGWEERTVITDACKNPEEVLRFIDFTCSPMGQRLVAWGVPNTPDSAWNYYGEDKWDFNQDFKASVEDGTWDYAKYLTLGGESLWFSMSMKPFRDDSSCLCWINQCFPDKWKKMMYDSIGDTLFDETARRIVFAPDNPLTVAQQRIDDAISTGWAKAVMSKTEEECEQNFYALQSKANQLGLKDIEAYRTEEFIKNLKAWGQY